MMPEVPFEIILQYSLMRSIEFVGGGAGWCGTRFRFVSSNAGESYPFKTFAEMRAWIVERNGWYIAHMLRHNHPEYVEAFDRERNSGSEEPS